MTQPIYITGLGALGSFGIGVKSLHQALWQGVNYIGLSQAYPELSFPLLQAELKDFNFAASLAALDLPAERITSTLARFHRSPIAVQAGLCAALEAWQQADLAGRVPSHKIGLIMAGHNTTSHESAKLHQQLGADLAFVSPSYALNFMDSQQLAAISEVLMIQGPGITIGGASASSHAALWQAYHWLQSGLVDACMVVGALTQLAAIELQALYNLGALGGQSFVANPTAACRPFDQAHEGFIPGQAAACVILETAEAATAPALAELAGVGLALAANHLSTPDLASEVKVMQQALAAAQLAPADIGYINAHATSTPLGDEIELQAIEQVFSGELAHIWINSTKSITGHCLWSAGLIETIATVLQLQAQFAHANVNLTHPIATQGNLVGPQGIPATIHHAINNGFGFGGINASLILSRGKV